MKNLEMLQICQLMKLGAVVNDKASLQGAVEEVVNIIGLSQIEKGDYKILYAFFVGLTVKKEE